jgi:hypothetical protein
LYPEKFRRNYRATFAASNQLKLGSEKNIEGNREMRELTQSLSIGGDEVHALFTRDGDEFAIVSSAGGSRDKIHHSARRNLALVLAKPAFRALQQFNRVGHRDDALTNTAGESVAKL